MADVFPNPLSGDPDELERDGTLYSQTSDAIADAIGTIRQLGSDLFSSQAVTALDKAQGDVVEKITRVQYRYWMAGGALTTYARALRQAQADALQALAAHGSISGHAAELQMRINEETQLAQQPGPDQMIHITQLQVYKMELQQAQSQQAAAEAQWNNAKATKDAAAKTARIAIHVGDEKNDLDDDLWDSLAQLIPVLLLIDKIMTAILKIVSLIMTVLAIVFTVLSLIFPILAPVAAALFGYAMLVNLAIAVLALLAFMIDGFHIMDLILVGVAVIATFGSSMLGDFLGAMADAAISEAMSGVSEAAGEALGAVAKNAITEGIKDVTKMEMEKMLSGSSAAEKLFEDVGPAADSFLKTETADEITKLKDAGTLWGGKLGGLVETGLDKIGFNELANDIVDKPLTEFGNDLSQFAKDGGFGNLQWAQDGYNAVQTHIIDPAHHLYNVVHDQGNAVAHQVTAFDPGHLISDASGLGSGHYSAGDVAGDKLGDVLTDGAKDWASAAANGHWGGAAQWAVHHVDGSGLPIDKITGAVGDKLGDIAGDMQGKAEQKIVDFSDHKVPSWM